MDLELNNKVALITGSSSGLGLAIAKGLAAEGANIILNGRNAETLQRSATQFPGCQSVVADVSDSQNCQHLIDEVIAQHGKLDILICNVGSGASVPPGEESAEEWRRVIATNLYPATQMVSAATPALAETKGVIVCVSSICGIEALGCPVAYAAAKSALNSFVANIARPLAKQGIRINALAPGNILFPGSVWERKLSENAEAVQAMLDKEVAQKRLGSAEEVADFSAFLASPRSSYATGTTYILDGGQIRS